jgi:hypothetical protein
VVIFSVYRPNVRLVVLAIIRQIYSYRDQGPSEIKDPTNSSNNPTKPLNMLQSLYILPSTHLVP